MDTRRDEAPPLPEEIAAADEAVFQVERVPRGARGRSVKAAMVVVALIGGLAVVGVMGGQHGPESAALPGTVPAGNDATTQDVAASAAIAGNDARPVPHDWGSPKKGDDLIAPPLLAIDANASDGLLFVHGDVYTRGASYVVVSISDEAHRTLDVKALNMPGGSTAFRTGPNDRFSVAFDLLDPLSRPAVWVSAEAYDHDGAIIATARAEVAAG